jgi:Ca-activated chloride channel family protein
VGVGTPRGELLKTSDPYGNAIFIKDEDGNPVKSLLNEPLLQRLSEAAQGFYLPLQSSRTMATLYERGIAPMEAVRFSSTTVRSRIERFQWPLGLGIVLLLLELLLPGASKAAGRLPQGSVVQAGAAAAVAFLLVGLPMTVRAESDDALERYRKGDFATSRQEYERLAQEKPEDFRLRFNAGAAAYRMDDFAGAAGLFEQVLRSPDLELQQQGWYNLGNARYRAGEAEQDPDKKREQWQQALSSYTAALKLNPGDPSAQANYKAVQQAIQTMPQPPPQQEGGKKNDPNKQDKQDKKDQKKDSKDGSSSDSQDSQSGQKDEQKDGQKKGKDSKKDPNSPPGDPSKQQQPSQDKNQDPAAGQGQKPDPQEGAQSQGEQGEQAGKKPGEGRQGKPSAAGAKPGQASGDRRGEAGEGAEAGEPDKDARQGELMTIREAEKVLDGQKGSEKALIFKRRGASEMGEGNGKSARRKAW